MPNLKTFSQSVMELAGEMGWATSHYRADYMAAARAYLQRTGTPRPSNEMVYQLAREVERMHDEDAAEAIRLGC